MRNYQLIHHRKKRTVHKETPEEEEAVIPTTKAKATRKHKGTKRTILKESRKCERARKERQ